MCKSFFPIFERCSVIQSSCIKIQVKGSSLIGTVKFFDGGVKKLGDFYVIIGTIEKCFAEIRNSTAEIMCAATTAYSIIQPISPFISSRKGTINISSCVKPTVIFVSSPDTFTFSASFCACVFPYIPRSALMCRRLRCRYRTARRTCCGCIRSRLSFQARLKLPKPFRPLSAFPCERPLSSKPRR